jgi:hypothetical protein
MQREGDAWNCRNGSSLRVRPLADSEMAGLGLLATCGRVGSPTDLVTGCVHGRRFDREPTQADSSTSF